MLRSRFLLIITTLGLVFDYAFSQLNVGDRDSNICSSSAIGKQNIACAAKKCLEDLAACQNGVSFSRLECNGEKPKTPEIEPVSVSCNSTISRDLRADLGWIATDIGYQYKLTPGAQTWWESRRQCQSQGGDLAYRGIRCLNIRRLLPLQELTWFGVTDFDNEGLWRWIDKSRADFEDIHWIPKEPNNHNDYEHCAVVFPNVYRSGDANCDLNYFGLCEKPLTS